ncbi:uncharacterized protein [Mytilus edulis]|uniref:uncharacterized protein n=1 Tax=Mytilus edulis TaxID=6550 RepID=UPI0039EDEABE
MHEAFLRDNQTLTQLQRQIATSNELVSITAHPLSSPTKAGIIKFDDVAFSAGIKNLTTYKSSGKFICEKEGLYLISVSIRSLSNGAYFVIYQNSGLISYTEIGYNSDGGSMAHTGTVILALQVHLNDSVWVYFPGAYRIKGGRWSTLTIIKLR